MKDFIMNENLETVKDKIFGYILEIGDDKTEELFSMLSEGKMLRSKLIFKIAGVNEASIKLCAIVEMIHAASLLHDDVIDETDTRRGKKSINLLYDNKTAIIFGDILYSCAFTKLTSMPYEICYSISKAVTTLSVGEMLDIDLTKEFNTSYDKYLNMIYKKTASLIEASAYCAAFLAKKDPSLYTLYGKNLGIAFQMVDDILDITQDKQTLGKPVLNDFVEGKVTIPYLLLYKKLSRDEKNKLQTLYQKALELEDSEWIKQRMIDFGVLEESKTIAKEFGLKAINAIKEENNTELISIMQDMIERSY